jgi:Two component regulator propeller
MSAFFEYSRPMAAERNMIGSPNAIRIAIANPRIKGVLALLALAALLGPPAALALEPSLDINQYAHTAWTIRDNFLKGAVRAIVQTSDGYLWLATEFGLVRFDGVRFVAWFPPQGHLPSDNIQSLLASRDGTLWIGTLEGLASWKDGKLNRYAEIYKIAAETLHNAFRHAQARRIEIEIRYDDEQLRLRVRDDGTGTDPGVFAAQRSAGHFGLRGMRERATLIGAKLTVWNSMQEPRWKCAFLPVALTRQLGDIPGCREVSPRRHEVGNGR